MSHTPGPWKIGAAQWRRYGPPYKIPISGASGTIANVITHDANRREGFGTLPPDKPNEDARLIAMAPEMFAFIKACELNLACYKSDSLPQLQFVVRELYAMAQGFTRKIEG